MSCIDRTVPGPVRRRLWKCFSMDKHLRCCIVRAKSYSQPLYTSSKSTRPAELSSGCCLQSGLQLVCLLNFISILDETHEFSSLILISNEPCRETFDNFLSTNTSPNFIRSKLWRMSSKPSSSSPFPRQIGTISRTLIRISAELAHSITLRDLELRWPRPD